MLWAGINAAMISQRARVVGEPLPDGTGEPDQTARLAHPQVLPKPSCSTSRHRTGRRSAGRGSTTLAAGSEVPVRDVRQPPGRPAAPTANASVFAVDAATGNPVR